MSLESRSGNTTIGCAPKLLRSCSHAFKHEGRMASITCAGRVQRRTQTSQDSWSVSPIQGVGLCPARRAISP